MTRAYTNPVYPNYFADPFVLRHDGVYYAYGTGLHAQTNGLVFEVLCSNNLIDWHSCGGALEPLGIGFEDYWAPEVAFCNGTFYMYYSAGIGDTGHLLRVATAKQPTGPFTDCGLVLTPDEPFSIDACPFCDDDGQWYLFYAKDFLEGQRLGTALCVAKLEDMTRLVTPPQTVLRASQDWQLYAKDRAMYGQVLDWYTLEGPSVVKRFGRYYCFYSGGAWTNLSYGVSYAVADHPLGPWSEPISSIPTVLKTIANQVIGPGHNSLVVAPDGQDYLVYHAWDMAQTGRRMCLDRLDWSNQQPCTVGPTFTPQVVPLHSTKQQLEASHD